MKRIELVLNQSVKDEFLEDLESRLPNIGYSFVDQAKGKGRRGKKLIDNIWPEENAIFISYVEEMEFKIITKVFLKLKKKYPLEGLKFYYMENAFELKLTHENSKDIIVEHSKE